MKKFHGFTLIELMLTLFIIGVLLAVGVPSVKTFMQNNQLIAATNDLVSGLHLARSEALKLNKKVTICVSNDGKTCVSSEKWTQGWIVFIDANDDRVGTGVGCSTAADVNTDCLLRVHESIDDPQLSVSGTYDSNAADIEWFTFTSRGMPKDTGAAQSGVFSVCSFDSSNAVINSRAVLLSLSGRVRVSDNAAVISCPASP